jgi:predicted metalloprotease with PDZ domain
VIALNIRKELVSKVSKEGLQALTADELKEIPEYFDLSDRAYQERLRAIFEKHARPTERNFDFFFQAQVLWDEAMAHNLDEFIRKNPEDKVIVLAGVGHMMYDAGIPKRLFKLNKKDYAVILNAGDPEKDIADFLLFPPPISSPESPKLGVVLKEEDKKIIISQFAPDSIAQKSGLEAGDIVLSLDDTPIESVDDLRIQLFSKKKGDEVTLRISRKRFLLGPGEKAFKIIL